MPANASAQLREIAAALRDAGDRGNITALRRGIRAGAAPLPAAVRRAAVRQLPHGGGLNLQVAGQRITVRVAMSARSTGVRLTTSAPDTSWTDRGFVKHPVFARGTDRQAWRWVSRPPQQIPSATGWWTHTLSVESPKITPVLMTELLKVRLRIAAASR